MLMLVPRISISMSTDAGAPFVRTTVSIREDYYQKLKRRGGNLSDQVNEILAKEFKKDHSMFGSSKPSRRDDVRDHIDRV